MANAVSSSAGQSRDPQLTHFFQPIFYWMRLLGVCLKSGDHPVATLYGIFMFSFNLASNVASMVLMILDDTEKQNKETYTFKQILVIDNFNFIMSAVGVHLMLLCQTRRRWKKLWNTLLEIEMQINKKILNRSVFITLLFIPEWIMIILVIPVDVIGLPLYNKLVEIASCASKIYPVSGMILFCLCGWIAADLLQLLLDELSGEECEYLCLNSLKFRYQQICQLVDDINQCFGLVMLIFITYTMASVSTVCFATVVELQHNERTSVPWVVVRDIGLVVQHFINLAIITYIPYAINARHEQIKLALGWIEIDQRNPIRRRQLEFFKCEVSQMSVALTASGLFNITPKLFPQMISNTVTYVIILWQFQSSENPLP